MLLNLALAGLAVWLVSRPRGGAGWEERSAVPAAVSPAGTVLSAPVVADVPFPPSVVYVTNRFAWSRIESEDFEVLAANLRAIGCPEKTVCDAVTARARRALSGLARKLEPALPFWANGQRREQANREARQVLAAAREKIITKVERVIGQGQFIEDPSVTENYVDQAVVRFVSGPMSEETLYRLVAALARHDSRRSEINASAGGVFLEADEAALAESARELQLELARVMSPAELKEFTARTAMMGLADQVLFEATDFTVAELRQLALLRSQVHGLGDGDIVFGERSGEEEQERFNALARQMFGEERFAQIERAGDDNFKTLYRISRDHQLPRDTAATAFELHQLAKQEAARLRADQSLPDTGQRLAAMQAETQAAMLKVLGPEAFVQYLNQGGAWVTNWSGL